MTSLKVAAGKPDLPCCRSGYRKERDWLGSNRHLHGFVESSAMNVGGPNAEGGSPPTKRLGVGGSIVVGARESRAHGEGSQLGGILTQINRMRTRRNLR
jgi:hypothetical protein